MQQFFAKVPLLPVWACLPKHKPVKQVIESLKALQRKSGTAQAKSTSSFFIFACNLSMQAASALDRFSKSACRDLLSWTCQHLVQTASKSCKNCRLRKEKVHLRNWCDLYHSHVLQTKWRTSEQLIQISNWTWFSESNPFKSSESTRMWKGLDRKPRCLQERRETWHFCHGLSGFLADGSHTTRPEQA